MPRTNSRPEITETDRATIVAAAESRWGVDRDHRIYARAYGRSESGQWVVKVIRLKRRPGYDSREIEVTSRSGYGATTAAAVTALVEDLRAD